MNRPNGARRRWWMVAVCSVSAATIAVVLGAPPKGEHTPLAKWGAKVVGADSLGQKGREALVIPFADGAQEVWMLRNADLGQADSVLVWSSADKTMIFEYHAKGRFGAPEAEYSGHAKLEPGSTGAFWMDLNADGEFDQKVVPGRSPGLFFLIGGRWMGAMVLGGDVTKGIITKEGRRLAFNAKSGRWEPAVIEKPDPRSRRR